MSHLGDPSLLGANSNATATPGGVTACLPPVQGTWIELLAPGSSPATPQELVLPITVYPLLLPSTSY